MPLSLLSLNLSLFFNIFFFILLGMLLGLVLLAVNLEVPLEQFLIAVCLFFDRAVLRRLTFANLIAHRLRNRYDFFELLLNPFISYCCYCRDWDVAGKP